MYSFISLFLTLFFLLEIISFALQNSGQMGISNVSAQCHLTGSSVSYELLFTPRWLSALGVRVHRRRCYVLPIASHREAIISSDLLFCDINIRWTSGFRCCQPALSTVKFPSIYTTNDVTSCQRTLIQIHYFVSGCKIHPSLTSRLILQSIISFQPLYYVYKEYNKKLSHLLFTNKSLLKSILLMLLIKQIQICILNFLSTSSYITVGNI